METSPPSIYEFGDFRLDAAKLLLFRRDGSIVPLTPRVFQTLLYMVEHSSAVLERERLMDAVWPDAIVEENNLTQNISTLRRVLGEGPESHRFIVTVPGRGYRFVADVRASQRKTAAPVEVAADDFTRPAVTTGADALSAPALPPRESSGRRKAWLVLLSALTILALGVALVFFLQTRGQGLTETPGSAPSLVSEKSIAVLPFANLSGDPENAYFADGIKDEILTRLSKIAALKVISRGSTQKFASAPENVRGIAQQLGVTNILQGSVRKAGETVRVTVELLNAQNSTQLWAETFDRKLTDIFQVESEVAQRIATALEATLTGAEKRALTAKPTVNVDAYQAYLKGRYFWNKRTDEGYQKAGEYFRQAIAIDPNYAPAYAGLSDVDQFNAFNAVGSTELLIDARESAQKAIALDGTLAEPHASLGLLLMNYDWDWVNAEKEFQRAIELNSNYATAHHWYAHTFIAVNRPEEALAEIQRARELDPLSLIINTDTGKMLYFARRYDDAIKQLRETLKMDPNFPQAHIWLGYVCTTTGLYEEAITEFAKVSDNSWAPGWLGYVYGFSGRREEAEKILGELKQKETAQPIDPHVLFCIYCGLGEKDQAFAALEKDYEIRSVGLTSLKVHPSYDSLRSDPRFADLLRRTNLGGKN